MRLVFRKGDPNPFRNRFPVYASSPIWSDSAFGPYSVFLVAFKASGECRINLKIHFSKFDQHWQGAVLISSSRIFNN